MGFPAGERRGGREGGGEKSRISIGHNIKFGFPDAAGKSNQGGVEASPEASGQRAQGTGALRGLAAIPLELSLKSSIKSESMRDPESAFVSLRHGPVGVAVEHAHPEVPGTGESQGGPGESVGSFWRESMKGLHIGDCLSGIDLRSLEGAHFPVSGYRL